VAWGQPVRVVDELVVVVVGVLGVAAVAELRAELCTDISRGALSIAVGNCRAIAVALVVITRLKLT
jgi:hypothetical protein